MTFRIVLIVLLNCFYVLSAADFDAYRKEVLNIGKIDLIPQKYKAKDHPSHGIVKPLFFDGLNYKSKPTRVYAYLGIPEKKHHEKLPAVVLVHGGGGTAFHEWVKEWNDRGYVAISLAVEGQTDKKETLNGSKKSSWVRHAWAGPKRHGIFADHQEPLTDQWMYHAVADVVLAHSLLASMPEVDQTKIGLMGISWGGIITSTVMGIDSRFAFVIPTYGMGSLHNVDNHYKVALKKQSMYQEVWDPMQRMHLAKMPALWYSWTGDTHFPIDIQSQNYLKAPGNRMVSYVPDMKHGHGAAWRPRDSYAFADSIVKYSQPWCIQKSIVLKNGQSKAVFHSNKKIERVTLTTTSDLGHTCKREWKEVEVDFSQSDLLEVNSAIPERTTGYFFNLYSGGLTVSSDYQDLTK